MEGINIHDAKSLECHSLAAIFPLIAGDAFAELVADIQTYGLREPVVVFENKILDGRNRYRACLVAGVEPAFTVYTGDDPISYVVSLNLKRRHLNESQRAIVAAKLATLKLGANQHSEGPSIEEASRLLNVGHASVERAKTVQRDGAAELIQAVERGGVSVSAAADIATLPVEVQRELLARCDDREITNASSEIRARKAEARRAQRIAKLAEISNSPIPSDRKYPVLLADPPWKFRLWAPDTEDRGAEYHYPCMETPEICKIPVPATPDAVLFLWVPGSCLPEALEVLEAWGFSYVTNLVWIKNVVGLGNWVRNQHELLLIGRRAICPHHSRPIGRLRLFKPPVENTAKSRMRLTR
jgi:ParB-like chromosome segregation protein Spo0J